MIIDFSVFESSNLQPTFKKGDLIISEFFYSDEVFLVLSDVYLTDERANAVFIGNIEKQQNPKFFILNFGTEITRGLKNHTVRNWHLRRLNDSEKAIICDYLYTDRNKISNPKIYLDVIEKISGIDLKTLPELVDYQVRTSANKYNL